MSAIECPREQDVVDAILSRRWPSRCDDELRTHVHACPGCADLVEVAAAFLEARDLDEERPEVPSASLVWWRAQLRAREEAARLARRPLGAARIAGLACASLLVIVALQAIAPAAWHWLQGALAWRPAVDADAALSALASVLANRAVQLGALASLVLGPAAVYLAVARD